MAAIENAGRDEFIMVGGAGSANVMEDIKADNTVLKATVIYPSTQAADGIRLARLLVAGQGDGRPGRGRGAARDQALRPGRHQGERRPVPADRLRVLTDPDRSRSGVPARPAPDRAAAARREP